MRSGAQSSSRWTALRQRRHKVKNRTQLSQAHAVEIEKLAESEIAVERIIIAIIAKPAGQFGNQVDIRALERGHRLPAGGREIRQIDLPARQKSPPTCAIIVDGSQ